MEPSPFETVVVKGEEEDGLRGWKEQRRMDGSSGVALLVQIGFACRWSDVAGLCGRMWFCVFFFRYDVGAALGQGCRVQ